ncbi:MAG: DNA polymerase domain-containing protein [archaeon]
MAHESLILIDVFEHAGRMYVWGQTENGENHYFHTNFRPMIFFDTFNEEYTREILKNQQVEKTIRRDFVKGSISVLKITFQSVYDFTENIREIEKKLRNVGTFYHVDIPLPEMFIFDHKLTPFGKMKVESNEKKEIITIQSLEPAHDLNLDYPLPNWKIMELSITTNQYGSIVGWTANGQPYEPGDVHAFMDFYESFDPDVVLLHHIPGLLIPLFQLCRNARSQFTFSRMGTDNHFKVRENSYFSYGKIYYKQGMIALKGRHLIAEYPHEGDGSEFTLLSYLEGSRVTRRTLQSLVSHSIGSASNNRLMYEAYQTGYVIPYKIGLYERIKPFTQLVENDRGPFTYEPTIGFHTNVIELDFASMYPSIMEHYNLSPEKYRCKCCPAPLSMGGAEKRVHRNASTPSTETYALNPFYDTGYWFCQKEKGIVPRVCNDIIIRRQGYKKRTDAISKAKVAYLKWLLVVIFGYQACTHKKIGTIEIHETINAIARETMVETVHLAEQHGFTVLHAIVDSLYVHKKNATKQEIQELIRAINEKTHLVLEYKATFQRMVFLPSIVNPRLPVPGRFYGIQANGEMKLRGIEARQKSQPHIIKHMQTEVLKEMAKRPRDTPIELFRACIPILNTHLEWLSNVLPEHLAFTVTLGKTDYVQNGPQKQILWQLRKRGQTKHPGQSVQYIIENGKRGRYIEVNRFRGRYDQEKYTKLIKQAYLNLFLPIYPKMNEVNDLLEGKMQTRMVDYVKVPLLVEV